MLPMSEDLRPSPKIFYFCVSDGEVMHDAGILDGIGSTSCFGFVPCLSGLCNATCYSTICFTPAFCIHFWKRLFTVIVNSTSLYNLRYVYSMWTGDSPQTVIRATYARHHGYAFVEHMHNAWN